MQKTMNASRSSNFRLAGFSVFLIVVLLCPVSASAAEWRWSGVDRIVAVGDVHGAYEALVRTLRKAGVLDEDGNWSAGRAHLVMTGDILDRGPESRQAMDLLMRLEGEAADAGGVVHVLLGNHEVMNLAGDLRYVSAAEYAAFADEESAADREQAFEAFKSSRTGTDDLAALKLAFEQRVPAGFFGHRNAFAPDGRYGGWLLEKPFIVVINDTAFVHGGLSPVVTEFGLDGVNRDMKAQLAAYARYLQILTDAGILAATENFYRHAAVLGALPEDPDRPARIEEAIAGAIKLQDAAIHDLNSPIWYRGNVACSAVIESDKLAAALKRIGAARVVIGHTPTLTGNLQLRLDGRVVEIDTGMLTAAYGGSGHALVIEGGRLLSVGEKGDAASAPVPQPRHVGQRPEGLDTSGLERLLATGELGSPTVDETGRTVVEVREGEYRVMAHFAENPRAGIAPELAAYRLDRLLELDMVPVTVARELDGESGSLQFLQDRTVDEAARRERSLGAAAWCPLQEQWNAMYVFDALIGNGARHPQSMLYDPNGLQLMLIGHEDAFGTRSGRPRYLKEVDLQLGQAWATALTSLTDEVLQAELGDVLDERRLRALARRRDDLLASIM